MGAGQSLSLDRNGHLRGRTELSPRERETCDLVLAGLSNREIAQRQGTTEQVVKNRMRGIFDKSGQDTRLNLALWWMRNGSLLELTGATDSRSFLDRVVDLEAIINWGLREWAGLVADGTHTPLQENEREALERESARR